MKPFRPAWWCPGKHLQTLWVRWFRRRPVVEACRARWTTPDGDFLDLDFVDGPLGSPRLLVLHGLEGSSESKYSRGLLSLGVSRGWRGVALNFRSCSGELNRGPRLYHSGETGDLDWVVGELLKRDPGAPVLPVGVSLGGNVLLKWLGERGENVPDGVPAAAAISTPYDLAASAAYMSRGVRRLYTRFFLRSLKAKALAKARQYPDLLEAHRIRRARSWRAYDDAVTAPLHGFRDADHYWAECSSRVYLSQIRRPTLLISARNDPFLPADRIPEEVSSPWLEKEFTSRGGHVGFVAGRWPWRARFWAERRAVDFLAEFVPSTRPALSRPRYRESS